ncbi:MAG: FtsX-like permease family protein [Sulfurovum sp.]|uniref:ABC transporter permease n=1 Tax=Sulfurovum sp. TaxID=1969726 RepID=UPI0028680333|nr:FtsX-like permease family protein [Sulfurovum sp.]MCO4845166.1 FtsX-like permease family protein [Sulfurovum sp.]
MNANAFWHFLTLQLFKERSKHLSIIGISVMILFLLSSVLFISSSLRFSLEETLKVQPDFVVSRIQGGTTVPTPVNWGDELIDIYGVSKVASRVYGRYFFEAKEGSFLIVGVDFLEEQSHENLQTLIDSTDIQAFFSGSQMLVGEGVKAYLDAHFYKDAYNFLTPKGMFEKVNIFKTLPSQTNLIANDMMIMPIDLARKILGYANNEVSDITFSVPNPDEWNMMTDKVSALYYDLHVVNKNDVQKSYENLYNYKGGLFLILFLVVLATFTLILYQRYSMVYSTERRHIGLLRALGWSINDVLKFKFMETLVVVFISYILGVFIAYVYVFILGAPLLKEVFLGGQNLHNTLSFIPIVDFSVLTSIFLLYALPFIAAVLIPVWRVSVTDPKEAML